MYAPAVHTHDTPPMPRWVRWLAFLVIAQTLLLGGIILVLLRQEARQDATDQIISQRGAIRDQQRTEDEERERLRLCELILVLPPDFAARGDLLAQLACPPAGDPAYEEAPDVPTSAPGVGALPSSSSAATRPSASGPTAGTTTPPAPTGTATTTGAPSPTGATTTAAPTTPPGGGVGSTTAPPPDPGLPGQLCLPVLGCLQL